MTLNIQKSWKDMIKEIIIIGLVVFVTTLPNFSLAVETGEKKEHSKDESLDT